MSRLYPIFTEFPKVISRSRVFYLYFLVKDIGHRDSPGCCPGQQDNIQNHSAHWYDRTTYNPSDKGGYNMTLQHVEIFSFYKYCDQPIDFLYGMVLTANNFHWWDMLGFCTVYFDMAHKVAAPKSGIIGTPENICRVEFFEETSCCCAVAITDDDVMLKHIVRTTVCILNFAT